MRRPPALPADTASLRCRAGATRSQLVKVLVALCVIVGAGDAMADYELKCTVKGAASESSSTRLINKKIVVAVIDMPAAIEIDGVGDTELLISMANQSSSKSVTNLSDEKNWYLQSSGKTHEGIEFRQSIKINKKTRMIEVHRKHREWEVNYAGKCKETGLHIANRLP